MSATKFAIETAVGLSLFGIAIPTQIYLSLQMRVLTIKERCWVIAFPLAAMIALYLGVGVTGAIHWWVVPSGMAASSILELAILRVIESRPVAPPPV